MNMNPMAATGAPGGPQNNAIAASSAPLSSKDIRTKFHTCIYDYFMKTQHYDIARTILREMGGDILTQPKQSPNRKDVNGNGDSMDGDSKEDVKKPDDLPHASVPPPADSPFLYEWFCQFWDLFEAQRNRGSVPAKTFLNHAQVWYHYMPIFHSFDSTPKLTRTAPPSSATSHDRPSRPCRTSIVVRQHGHT